MAAQWLLDFVDGFLARVLCCETRLGACFDAQSDRLVLGLFLLTAWQQSPPARVAIVCCLAYVVLIDGMMFTQAMQTGVLSTNYFFVVDRRAWRLCWSPAAKFVTAFLGPILILLGNPLQLATAVIAVAALARVPVLRRVLVGVYSGAVT